MQALNNCSSDIQRQYNDLIITQIINEMITEMTLAVGKTQSITPLQLSSSLKSVTDEKLHHQQHRRSHFFQTCHCEEIGEAYCCPKCLCHSWFQCSQRHSAKTRGCSHNLPPQPQWDNPLYLCTGHDTLLGTSPKKSECNPVKMPSHELHEHHGASFPPSLHLMMTKWQRHSQLVLSLI